MGDKVEKKERRFSQEQYDMLMRCSEKRDITEWNEWRGKYEDIEIHLEDVLLNKAHLENATFDVAHMENADISFSHLEGAFLGYAYLEDANAEDAHLESAYLGYAHLEDINAEKAHLEGADLEHAHLENAYITEAHLEGAYLFEAHLEGAYLFEAHLEGAHLIRAYLESADFSGAILDDKTHIWKCNIDRNTDFRGVGLGNVRIDPGTRALLEYNCRRMNWEDWYKDHPFQQWPVRFFWFISDYGRSSGRIMSSFLGLAIILTMFYTCISIVVTNNTIDYFFDIAYDIFFKSLSSMTTLNFNTEIAGCNFILRRELLLLQYMMGYVFLGALITRLSILFTAGGPSADFAPEWKPKKEEPPRQPDTEPASPEPNP